MTRRKTRKKVRRADGVRQFVAYVAIWSVLWWLLSAGRVDSWLVGAPTVAAAATASAWLAPSHTWRWSVQGLARFTVHFVRAALAGGLDVAYRALHPHLPIDPQLVKYITRLPPGTARVFFANVISLCPGTVSASLRDRVLIIHVLDGRQPNRVRLAALEEAVARLFAVELSSGRTGSPGAS